MMTSVPAIDDWLALCNAKARYCHRLHIDVHPPAAGSRP